MEHCSAAGKGGVYRSHAYDISTLLKVKVSADASLINYKTQNIVGYVPGRSSLTLFSGLAHYDHLGKMGDKVYFPGANDNAASGVAMLLNLAKYYNANPHRYSSVVFIALGAEEIGIVGAKHFVDNPLFDLKRIKFLVNFDLAGTEEGIKVANGSVYRDRFDHLKYNEASKLPEVCSN